MNRINLCGEWKWKKAGEDKYHIGSVPGSVYSDMLAEGSISDPFWRTEEYKVRELMMDDFIYSKCFSVTGADLEHDAIYLVAEGLDTIADITLNGHGIASVNDMHRTYRFDVKPYLIEGENVLSILFRSSLKYVRERDAESDIFYASTGCIHGNGYLRKAHYMFGWDWGPQLPDAGIFRPIYIEEHDTARIKETRIHQIHEDGKVFLQIDPEVEKYQEKTVRVLLRVVCPDGRVLETLCTTDEETILEIPDPELWWPNNLGDHPLYTVSVELFSDDELIDTASCRIGLRTITVSTEKDEFGNEFCFVVNGQKVFAMGANYVPQDNLISRVGRTQYERIVQDAEKSNFNCIRVWGGGYYPDDSFYDACDECGILVWQDLMFACNVYDLSDDFERNIIEEIHDNIRRIRNHASLALICGNNEMEWLWSDEPSRIRGHRPKYKADYIRIFSLIIPRAVKEADDVTFFWESSPSSSGSFDVPNDFNRGDQHYWDVWHSGKPFTEYRNHYFRFCSEYGFQSFPSYKTIAAFALPSDRNIFSRVMESHQKNKDANSKIFQYISDYYLYPESLDSIAYISQVLQLRAIQYGVEHWRCNRGRCMGSLYWQLNDCWPVASWAGIDYYGRWKALHYGARHFYAPVTVSAFEKEELSSEISYWILNESKEKQDRRLEIDLMDTAFRIIYHTEIQGSADPFSSSSVCTVDFAEYLKTEDERASRFARVRMYKEDTLEEERVTLFVKPKYFSFIKPVYSSEIKERDDKYFITIRASVFAQFTELSFRDFDVVLSDNFFDITSMDGITVSADKADFPAWVEAGDVMRNLMIRSIADSYKLPDR